MFQQILLVVDAESVGSSAALRVRAVQTASVFSQAYGSKLSLLQFEIVEDAPLLLFSELDRSKEWSTSSTFRNVAGGTTLVRPTKLKIVGTEPSILNQLQDNFGQVGEIFSQTRSLESANTKCSRAIADVARLCKAELAIVGLSQTINHTDLVQAIKCPILIL